MPIAFDVRSVSGTDRSTVLARETIFYRRLVEVEARIPMRFRQRRLGDGGKQSHPTGACRTAKRIDLEDAFQEIGPSNAPGKRIVSDGAWGG